MNLLNRNQRNRNVGDTTGSKTLASMIRNGERKRDPSQAESWDDFKTRLAARWAGHVQH